MEKRRSDLARHQLFATLLAWVVGTWLQLLQPSLKSVEFYLTFLTVAGVFVAYIAILNIAKKSSFHTYGRSAIMLVISGLLAFGLTGLRAVDYASHTLRPAYEGRDIEVVGVVSAMPQINECRHTVSVGC